MTPNTIEFKTTSNTLMDGWVMRITADRRIEVNEDVDVTEAAKKVLEAMQLMLDNQKRTFVGLSDEDRFELAKAQHGWEGLLIAAEAKLKQKNFKE
jgi:hypothetical protein